MQANQQPTIPLLNSLAGFQYGDLILALDRTENALARGRAQLDLAERFLGQGMDLKDIGMAHLLIGRALAIRRAPEAAAALDAAVVGLRKAGRSDYLPLALLARAAERRRLTAERAVDLIAEIHADLDEAADIAGEEMKLYLTDLALERARLALDLPGSVRYQGEAAAAQVAVAAGLIAETGYHRRDEELEQLRVRLGNA